jgi:hypothetical protein
MVLVGTQMTRLRLPALLHAGGRGRPGWRVFKRLHAPERRSGLLMAAGALAAMPASQRHHREMWVDLPPRPPAVRTSGIDYLPCFRELAG